MQLPANRPSTMLLIGVVLLAFGAQFARAFEVIYAVNAGGEAHTDSYGIHYERDPLSVGTASDYGRKLKSIGRVKHMTDETLFHTERYHTATFGYDLPLRRDGSYVLVLRFCEVYFNAPNLKVFDVALNQVHVVVSDLDIFRAVGQGVAHEERIEFRVQRNRLYIGPEESPVRNGRIRIDFIKGQRDNPKINTIALFRLDGSPADSDQVPQLMPLRWSHWHDYDDPPAIDEDEYGVAEPAVRVVSAAAERKPKSRAAAAAAAAVVDEDSEFGEYFADEEFDGDVAGAERTYGAASLGGSSGRPSGPRLEDPYALDHSSVMLPVFIAIAAFIPLLVCLCKL